MHLLRALSSPPQASRSNREADESQESVRLLTNRPTTDVDAVTVDDQLKMTQKRDGYAVIVKQSLAAGMSVREAQAHARKILAERDIIIIGRDGKSRTAAAGPSILKQRTRKALRRKDIER